MVLTLVGHGSIFFQPQPQTPQYSPHLRHTQFDTLRFPQRLLPLPQRSIGPLMHLLPQALLHLCRHLAERPVPLLDAFHPTALPLLARDFLHPTQTDSEPLHQYTHRLIPAAWASNNLRRRSFK